MGRTIALYGETDSGKTTQLGIYAKWLKQTTGGKLRLFASDLGGYESIEHLSPSCMDVVAFDPETDDPFVWILKAVEGNGEPSAYAANAFDSGSFMAELLLSACAKLAANDEDIGGRPAPKFVINKKGPKEKQIKLGSNVDSHYLTVQGIMRDAIFRSTWLKKYGDVIWTFGLYKGENQTDSSIYGPQVAGKALTPVMPKWFNYTFPLLKEVQAGVAPTHRLLLQPQPDPMGLAVYYANSRYPIDASTPLPLWVEPANLIKALELIQLGKDEAALTV